MGTLKPSEIINDLLKKYASGREFARAINEDTADISRWRTDTCAIKARAVVAICQLHPEILPYNLNPAIFPKHLTFKFGANNE